MTIKEFVKEIKPKKMDKDELICLFTDHQHDIIEFVIKHSHKQKYADTAKDLYMRLNNQKAANAIKKVAKNDNLDCGFAVVIAKMFETLYTIEGVVIEEEVKNTYYDIIDKVLKKRVKEVNKKLNLDTEIIKELLIITPDVSYISSPKFVSFYSQPMLRKLYMLAKDKDLGITETKQVKKLFSKLFGKDLLDVIAIHILLEKKGFIKNYNEKQTAIWNLMTKFALETIEGQDKAHIIELIEYYCELRKKSDANGRDGARRIVFTEISAEEYPRIAKAVSKVQKNGKESLVKFL